MFFKKRNDLLDMLIDRLGELIVISKLTQIYAHNLEKYISEWPHADTTKSKSCDTVLDRIQQIEARISILEDKALSDKPSIKILQNDRSDSNVL